MKVLFVCSGNICRSPMAAEYFRVAAARGGLSHAVVSSAGLLGIDDAPASPEAERTMREIGIDLARHRSTGITPLAVRSADVVIAMTDAHVEELRERFGDELPEHHKLRAFESGSTPTADAPDLDDPIGRPAAFYREQLPIVTRSVDHLVLYLKHAEG